MFRTRSTSINGSSSSIEFFSTGLVALLVAAGCSAANSVAPEGVGGSGLQGAGGAAPYTGTCPSALFTECKNCHDGRGTAATPMGLMYWEDFHAPSHANPSLQVYQILSERLHRTTPSPMPPEGTLDASKLAAIDAWAQAGAPDCGGFARKSPPPPPPGSGGTGNVTGNGGRPNVPGGGGTPVVPGGGGTPVVPGGGGTPAGSGGGPTGNGGAGYDIAPYLSPDGKYFIKEPPGDKPVGPDAPGSDYCFNIVAHGAQKPLSDDPTPFSVAPQQFYHNFVYKVPYDKPVWALSTRPIIDNNKVLHHWLFFQMGGTGTDGSHADEIGLQTNNALLTGWAPGGNPLDMPAGVGLEMPAPGGYVSMENHYSNSTGMAQNDRSGVRMCVSYTKPTNPASLTWLGTEAISIPANQQGTAVGTCSTWKKSGDVHVFQVIPHMHQLGTNMKTVVNRGGSTTQTETLIDKPFAFADQRAYPADMVIHATDTMTTTCTFKNTTSAAVGFGTFTSAEMCYNFVVYYPAHALDGIGGIEGSKNMCLF